MILLDSAKPFYKANFHLHTTNSDGRRSPEEAIALYREQGYDVLAITDHWKVTRESHLDEGMLVLSGVEFDFNLPGQVIHMLGLGVQPDILEKVSRASGPQRAADEISRQGGVAVLAHPAWSLNPPSTMCALSGVTCAEVYNTVSGTPWNGDRADSTSLLDVTAAQGKLYRFLATDDAHFYNGDQCRSFTMLQAESLTQEGVLAALKSGAFYASRGPEIYRYTFDGEVFTIDCSPSSRIVFSSDLNWVNGRCVAGENLTHAEYVVQTNRYERFVRCQIWDANGLCAWTSPVAVGPNCH